MVPAIETGYFQREIADAAYRYQREVERGERLIVGVNAFEEAESEEIPTLQIDPALEARQVERVRALRTARNAAAVEKSLADVREHADGTANLVPVLLAAARAGATLGETCDALRDVWGVWRETPVF